MGGIDVEMVDPAGLAGEMTGQGLAVERAHDRAVVENHVAIESAVLVGRMDQRAEEGEILEAVSVDAGCRIRLVMAKRPEGQPTGHSRISSGAWRARPA